MSTTPIAALRRGLLSAAAAGAACGAHAQSSVPDAHWRAGSSYGAIAVGRSHFGTSCGTVAGLTCRNAGTAVSLAAGDMFTDHVGAELSYLDFGHADRAGGSVRARALGLALVGRLPLGDRLQARGKVGGTFGVTHTSAAPAAGLPTGRATGWGLGYGVGLDYHISRRLDASVEWQRHDLHFAGQGTSPVSLVTAGVGFRF